MADVVAAVEQEEWTTQKKIVNHKTRQTETRVARQIVMEDGKVIADSGPQVTSRTNEDVQTEETERSNKKDRGDRKANPAIGDGYIRVPGSTNVVDETTETRKTTKSNKNENLQYHDEGLKELTGFEVHKKAICSPNDLIALREDVNTGPIRGKLIHYSKNGKTLIDTEETKELAKKNQSNGASSVEVTKTYNHEEIDESELPTTALRGITVPESFVESSKSSKFYRNFDPEDEEDVLEGINHQRKALTGVEKFHEDSMNNASIDHDYNYAHHHNLRSFSRGSENNNVVAKRWVDHHFSDADSASISDKSGSSMDGEIVRKVRTKAGGNVINIELENTRKGSPGSVRSVGSSPRVFDNHRYKETRTSRTVLNSEDPSVLDLVSAYHHATGEQPPTMDTASPPPRSPSWHTIHKSSTGNESYKTSGENTTTKEYYFGLNSAKCKEIENNNNYSNTNSGQQRVRVESRTSSKRGDSPSSYIRHPRDHSHEGRRSGTPNSRASRTGGNGFGDGTFYFGAENDPSYHKTVSKERYREKNSGGEKRTTLSPTDDPRPGVMYHQFKWT